MYLPRPFIETNPSALWELISAYPFATLITSDRDGESFVGHLPIVIEKDASGAANLIGHLARANPQWKHFAYRDLKLIFHGPHTYITPQWYPSSDGVPTWNYAVVHASGRAELVETFEGIERILDLSVSEFERVEPSPWNYALPEEDRIQMVKRIIGFRIRSPILEGKFKLSQNRTPEERAGVLAGLAHRKDQASAKVCEFMLR